MKGFSEAEIRAIRVGIATVKRREELKRRAEALQVAKGRITSTSSVSSLNSMKSRPSSGGLSGRAVRAPRPLPPLSHPSGERTKVGAVRARGKPKGGDQEWR